MEKDHEYLSTACFHDDHDYCQSYYGAMGIAKRPAQCKFCGAPCLCQCHLKNRFDAGNASAA